jgi:hypothetical protein
MGTTRTLSGTVTNGGQWAGGSAVTSGTAVTTSGAASYSFTGIPAWVKKISILFRAVSVNAAASTAGIQVQLGTSAGLVTSGYNCTIHTMDSTTLSSGSLTTAFLASITGADAHAFTGMMKLNEIAPNVWVEAAQVRANTTRGHLSSGDVSLGAELTTITVLVGVGAFDGGTINILYE